MLQTNYISGSFCQRDYDPLDEKVRTLLFWFGSVRIVGRFEVNCFQFYLVQTHSTNSPQATRCPVHAVLPKKAFEISSNLFLAKLI